jgi:hypothetical protein
VLGVAVTVTVWVAAVDVPAASVKESDVGDAEIVPAFTVKVTGTFTGAVFGAETVTCPG